MAPASCRSSCLLLIPLSSPIRKRCPTFGKLYTRTRDILTCEGVEGSVQYFSPFSLQFAEIYGESSEYEILIFQKLIVIR